MIETKPRTKKGKKQTTKKMSSEEYETYITYSKLFWLFLLGSVAGVIIEGVFCLIKKGHWESHVVSVFGAFNILYGFGAVIYYVGAVKLREKYILVRVLSMTIMATMMELSGGLLLRYGLGMRAWDYDHNFLNYKGIICLSFSVAWAIVAYFMCKGYPYINRFLDLFQGKYWKRASVVLSAIMVVDILFTCIFIVRWSERHYGIDSNIKFLKVIDIEAPDDWIQSRFVEWRFLE